MNATNQVITTTSMAVIGLTEEQYRHAAASMNELTIGAVAALNGIDLAAMEANAVCMPDHYHAEVARHQAAETREHLERFFANQNGDN